MQIIDAPGVGKYISILNFRAQYKFGGTPFGNANNAVLSLCYGNGQSQTNVIFNLVPSGILDQASDVIAPEGTWASAALSVNPTNYNYYRPVAENQPVVLSAIGGAGNLTNGNGTLVLSITYTIEEIK